MQVMVFFSSCAAVKYHAELLNYIDMPVKDIHGKQKQVRSLCRHSGVQSMYDQCACRPQRASGACPFQGVQRSSLSTLAEWPSNMWYLLQLTRPHVLCPCRSAPHTLAGPANEHLHRVLRGIQRHAAVHGRGSQGAGHPGCGLDHPVRSPRRPQGVHPPSGAHRKGPARAGPRPAAAAPSGAGVPEVPAGGPPAAAGVGRGGAPRKQGKVVLFSTDTAQSGRAVRDGLRSCRWHESCSRMYRRRAVLREGAMLQARAGQSSPAAHPFSCSSVQAQPWVTPDSGSGAGVCAGGV